MAVADPDNLCFDYFGGGGAGEIAYELSVDSADWVDIAENDVYLWSYANLRAFWSFGDFDSPIMRYEVSGPTTVTVVEGFWLLSSGRLDIQVISDLEQVTVKVEFFTIAGASIGSVSPAATTRAQTTTTLAAVASTATEGYFVVEMTPQATSTTASIYGLKIIERRIAQGDL